MASSRVADDLRPAPSGDTAAAPQGRLLGLDVVRAIAILSMTFVHVWPTGWWKPILPPADAVPLLGWLNVVLTQRAMSLFIFCAGVSVALVTGAANPPSGRRMSIARRRLAVRSAVMFPLALALLQYGEVILTLYCFWFVMLLPLTRLRARPLFVAAAVCAAVGPVLRFVMLNYVGQWSMPHEGFSLLLHPADLLYFVAGPDTLYASALLLAGMAVGRLDLHAHAVRVRLAAAGGAVVAGALLMWGLAAGPLGGARTLAAITPSRPGSGELPWIALFIMRPYRMFDISLPMGASMIGLGMLLIGVFLIVTDKAVWGRVLWPVAAMGSVALTCYVGHFLLLIPFNNPLPYSFAVFAGVTVVMIVAAALWRRRWRRGPLEWLVHRAMVWAVPGDQPRDETPSRFTQRVPRPD
ncbi:DUF418 domain-containing protein [Sphaerisporangium aureirubrum]|uniref:DUF418 domain-containing protein n=1 Tax=Sphaerisporangium aureirubrum TaxID=1544736 RepID=A0ABW1NV76_9ACTN